MGSFLGMGETATEAFGPCCGARVSKVPEDLRALPWMTQEHFEKYQSDLAQKWVGISPNKAVNTKSCAPAG